MKYGGFWHFLLSSKRTQLKNIFFKHDNMLIFSE